ncbi:MAG: hypothetical protein KDA44_10610 [Planctomycetales bacterium]|nr:hypothetical protein [Planctomycetales bacterium]
MAATAEKGTVLMEGVFDEVRKAAETNLKLSQEMMRQWVTMWPGIPTPQSMWLDKMRDFQKSWTSAVSELARKHRDTVDRQYQAALESLDQALKFAEAKNPDEFRKRSEELCRKTIDCVKECTEAQVKEFQNALTKLTELTTQSGS